MCLILFSWKTDPEYDLVMAANRDEFYLRPTAVADFWDDHPHIVAGRDLEAGGTWMGITETGRLAAITNYRDPSIDKQGAPSRGHLTADFLKGQDHPGKYMEDLRQKGEAYNGFNLLVGDRQELWYYNNINHEVKQLEPGNYGLSNALLDTSWPKVELGKRLFQEAITNGRTREDYLHILKNSTKALDGELPATGIPYEWEKAISSMFIETENYGTCCSTILTFRKNGPIEMVEKSYPVGSRQEGLKAFQIPHV